MNQKWKKSREAFINYSTRTYGRNVKASLLKLEPTLFHPEPKNYTSEEYNNLSPMDQAIWNLDCEDYLENRSKLSSDLRKLYDVLWDQCEHSMKLKIESSDRYQHISESADVIELLNMIDSICNPKPHLEQAFIPASTLAILEILRNELDPNNDSASSNGIAVQWKTLPDWVVKTTRSIFFELFKATEIQHQQFQRKEPNPHVVNRDEDDQTAVARVHLFSVIATLMCLNSMGIRDVSCSPLPMLCCSSNSLGDDFWTELLFGMSLNPAVSIHMDDGKRSASMLSTAIGISMLRVLTGASDPQLRSRTRPFTLQKRGLGADDQNSNTVSVLMGIVTDNSGDDSSANPPAVDQQTSNAPNANAEPNPKSMANGETENNNTNAPRLSQATRNPPNASLFQTDCVAHMETNLDDMSGENLAFAIEILLKHGAMDAWIAPIVMKKGRPAHTLHCLCPDNDGDDNDNDGTIIDALLKLLFLHTSTLGVRVHRKIPRAKLDRSICSVTTPFTNTSRRGLVDVKVSRFKTGQLVRRKAEFDHCRNIAIETGVGVQTVAEEAVKAFDNNRNDDDDGGGGGDS